MHRKGDVARHAGARGGARRGGRRRNAAPSRPSSRGSTAGTSHIRRGPAAPARASAAHRLADAARSSNQASATPRTSCLRARPGSTGCWWERPRCRIPQSVPGLLAGILARPRGDFWPRLCARADARQAAGEDLRHHARGGCGDGGRAGRGCAGVRVRRIETARRAGPAPRAAGLDVAEGGGGRQTRAAAPRGWIPRSRRCWSEGLMRRRAVPRRGAARRVRRPCVPLLQGRARAGPSKTSRQWRASAVPGCSRMHGRRTRPAARDSRSRRELRAGDRAGAQAPVAGGRPGP